MVGPQSVLARLEEICQNRTGSDLQRFRPFGVHVSQAGKGTGLGRLEIDILVAVIPDCAYPRHLQRGEWTRQTSPSFTIRRIILVSDCSFRHSCPPSLAANRLALSLLLRYASLLWRLESPRNGRLVSLGSRVHRRCTYQQPCTRLELQTDITKIPSNINPKIFLCVW